MDTNQKNMVEKNGEECLRVLPVGFRFRPTDYEALKYYLLAKVTNEKFHAMDIHEVDVYQYHPFELPGMHPEEKVAYYFTSRTKRYANGERPNRFKKGDDGAFWKMNGQFHDTKNPNETPLGRRNTLNYHLNSKMKTDWKMHEFVLHESMLPTEGCKLGDMVLCKIYQKKKADGEKRAQETEESQGDIETNSRRVQQKVFPGQSSTVVQQAEPNWKYKLPPLQSRPEVGLIGNPLLKPQPIMIHNTQGSKPLVLDEVSNEYCQMLASNIGQHQPSFDNAPYMDSHAINGNADCHQVLNIKEWYNKLLIGDSMLNHISTNTLSNDFRAPPTDYSRQSQLYQFPIDEQAGYSRHSQLYQLVTSMPSNDFQAPLAGYIRQSQLYQQATSMPSNDFQAPPTGCSRESQSHQPVTSMPSNDFQAPPTGCSRESQSHQLASSMPSNDFQAPPTGCSWQSQAHQLATSTPSDDFQTPPIGYNSQSQPPISCNDLQAPPTGTSIGCSRQSQAHQPETSTTSNEFQTHPIGYNSQSQPPISCNDLPTGCWQSQPPINSSFGEEFIDDEHYMDYASYFSGPTDFSSLF